VVKLATRPQHAGYATLVHDLTIGVVDGAEEYMFTRVNDLLLKKDGSIIVADLGPGQGPASKPSVKQFDSQGKYVRTIGRVGQGPGEFITHSGIVELRDGKLALRDMAGHRINTYTAAGEPVDTWPLGTGARSFGLRRRLVVDTAGILNAYGAGGLAPHVVRMWPDGRVIDTQEVRMELAGLEPVRLRAFPQGRGSGTPVPYYPAPAWTFSPLGYLITVRTDRYAIDLRIPPSSGARQEPTLRGPGALVAPRVWRPGDPIVSIRRTTAPVRISTAERSARRSAIETSMREANPTWRWNGPEIPQTKPPIRGIFAGDDGTIWVQVSVASEPHVPDRVGDPTAGIFAAVPFLEPSVYDVFEPNGTYVGQVRAPDRTVLLVLKRDVVWGVHRGEDDVNTVRRFRVQWR
jgi:hypothetical protein